MNSLLLHLSIQAQTYAPNETEMAGTVAGPIFTLAVNTLLPHAGVLMYTDDFMCVQWSSCHQSSVCAVTTR